MFVYRLAALREMIGGAGKVSDMRAVPGPARSARSTASSTPRRGDFIESEGFEKRFCILGTAGPPEHAVQVRYQANGQKGIRRTLVFTAGTVKGRSDAHAMARRLRTRPACRAATHRRRDTAPVREAEKRDNGKILPEEGNSERSDRTTNAAACADRGASSTRPLIRLFVLVGAGPHEARRGSTFQMIGGPRHPERSGGGTTVLIVDLVGRDPNRHDPHWTVEQQCGSAGPLLSRVWRKRKRRGAVFLSRRAIAEQGKGTGHERGAGTPGRRVS